MRTSMIRRALILLSLGFAVALVAVACSEPAPPPPPAAPAVKSPEARAAFYQDCWNQFNDKAWDKFQNCYTDDAKSENIDGNPPVVMGRTAIVDAAKQAATAFPDRRGEVRLLLINGSHGASIALYTGTNTGAMPPGPDGKPGPATNKAIGLLMAHTIELDSTGSAAMSDAGYVDEATLTSQLGLNPAPARPVAKPTGAATVVAIAKNDDTERANLATTQAIFEAVNKHDLKGIESHMADTYKSIEVARPADLGKKESLASTKEMFGSFPDVKITPTTTWAAGDYVVIYGTFDGTNTGDIPSQKMKATGKHLNGRFCEIMKLENGKVTDDYLFYNGAAFQAQLMAK